MRLLTQSTSSFRLRLLSAPLLYQWGFRRKNGEGSFREYEWDLFWFLQTQMISLAQIVTKMFWSHLKSFFWIFIFQYQVKPTCYGTLFCSDFHADFIFVVRICLFIFDPSTACLKLGLLLVFALHLGNPMTFCISSLDM